MQTDFAPVLSRLESILAIADEPEQDRQLIAFRDELPQILLQLNTDPEQVRAMEAELARRLTEAA